MMQVMFKASRKLTPGLELRHTVFCEQGGGRRHMGRPDTLGNMAASESGHQPSRHVCPMATVSTLLSVHREPATKSEDSLTLME